MKKVLVFGTFDLLHPGHNNFFEQARSYGDFLIVVVSTDKNATKAKGVKPRFSEEERLLTVIKQTQVDKAILGSGSMDYLTTIRNENPQTIALGYDQNFDMERLKAELAKAGLKNITVVRLKPFFPEKYKSSILKSKFDSKLD